ncbi:filamin-binding LIM protein 1 isoform X2 [Spea bombifrons]|uniref:filamin-binding LIM protein 1 isoform X2 n=1 Tax=Spea bombifrons TaxID=233779 RepID=UPI00234A5BF6|nr:filamin-binding LIM protein 1 isoform X2 [Spea bombifrons]
MSGKRMVSSVHITLTSPWRAEIPHKAHPQVDKQGRPREGQELSLSPPHPQISDNQSVAEQADIQNGGFSSFPYSFLDDIPATDDFLGPDLPPPPPTLLSSPKKIPRNSSSAPVHDLPPPPPPPPTLLSSPKKIPRDPSSAPVHDLPPPPLPPPSLLSSPKKIPRDPSSAPVHDLPPPPPPPPSLLNSPKKIPRDPSSAPVHDLPPPPPPPPSLLNSPKEIPRDPSSAPVHGLPSPSLLKSPKQIPQEAFSVPDLPPPPPDLLTSSKQIPLDPSPAPVPDSLRLELMKLDLTHSTSAQLNSEIPTELNVTKSVPGPYTQQKREEPMPARKPENGYPGKQEDYDVCAFCHKSIAPNAAAIEAMKKQYHASCFTCRKCHRLLAGQLYYQKDGQPICEHCYKDTLEKCAKCQTLITQHIVRAMGNGYHPECFTCVVCHRRIADESFAVDEYNDVHCADDYYRKYAPICSACGEPIIPGERDDSYKIECLGKNFHENCYRCERCHISLSLEPTESGCYPRNGHLLCKPCHLTWKDGGS